MAHFFFGKSSIPIFLESPGAPDQQQTRDHRPSRTSAETWPHRIGRHWLVWVAISLSKRTHFFTDNIFKRECSPQGNHLLNMINHYKPTKRHITSSIGQLVYNHQPVINHQWTINVEYNHQPIGCSINHHQPVIPIVHRACNAPESEGLGCGLALW